MKALLAGTLLLFNTLFCMAENGPKNGTAATQTLAESNVNIRFYHIDLEFDLEKPFIKGAATVEFIAVKADVKEFSLDLDEGLKVAKVEGAASFKQVGNELFISLEKALDKDQNSKVKVFYEGTPNNIETEIADKKVTKGLIHSDRGEGEKKNRLVVTACYPNLGHKWFPCKSLVMDKADSVYVDITIAEKTSIVEIDGKKQKISYTAVSNGMLEGIDKMEGKRKYKWRHRYSIAPHHVLVAISNFAKMEEKYKSKEEEYALNFYIFPETYEQSKATITRASEIMACLSRTFGNYPFNKECFSVVETGIALGDGMPTQTAVLVEDLKSFHIYQVVHQAAAMWFGNHISPEQWQDAWITEALATYAEAMWQEYKRGLNVFQIILDEKEYFEGGKLYLDKMDDYSKDRLSKKGMYVIHMLRGIMGDTHFFETLKGITGQKRSRSTYINTKQFKEICEYYASENEEKNYGYFFEQWVKGELYPTYHVEYETLKKGELNIKVKQLKNSGNPEFFKMPVKTKIIFEDGTVQEELLQVEAKEENVYKFPVTKAVKSFEFDPQNWVFKNLKCNRRKLSTKTPIENFNIETSEGRRVLKVSFKSVKAQDIKIELIRKADGVAVKTDEVVHTQALTKVVGEQNLPIKIPVKSTDRDVFELRITGKSDVYVTPLRVVALEAKFE